MGKKGGKVSNRARDMLCDYYMTNEVSRRQNRAGQENRGTEKGSRRSEMIYIGIIVTGLIGISIKYFVI